MRTAEYNNYKKHILEYMEAEDIKANIEAFKERRDCPTTWKAGEMMTQDGFFACYYSQVIEVLKEIYGKDYKAETYETKNGDLRWKNGEAYCWTIYKAKIARTIETMERKGEL